MKTLYLSIIIGIIASAVGNITLPFTVSGVEEPQQKIGNPISLYDSPLEQFNSGVLSKFVKCNYDLNLLINTHNFQPVCVKETSIARLLNQGWNLPNQCVTGPVDAHFIMDVLGMIVIPKNASDVNAGKSYEPQNATVVIGLNNTVDWFNMDDFGSSVTSDDGIFDSGLILPNHTWKYKFECAGKYEYHDVSYPWLKGAVTVLPFG
ncbi:MAG: hypothetical protein KGH88_06675 [Thaumarchaeota archaeon]|nr:hypothetical protein [Nitrososphaerota archaeon]